MPFENEHSARLRDPDDFSDKSFRRKDGGIIFGNIKVPKSIAIIWAKLKGSDASSDNPLPQALRFDKSNWTVEQAKQWLKNNELDDNVILFEPAEEKMEEAAHLKKQKEKKKMKEAGHLDDGESTLVGFEVTTSQDEGHTHTATLDESGTGTTSPGPKDGHVHGVKNFDVLASSGDETKEHVHQITKRVELREGIRPAFGSTGGKRHLAKLIASHIPEHKTYVEPFIGGGAVFFAKEASEREFINDKDPDIALAYRFIKEMTDAHISSLGMKENMFDRDRFFRIRDSEPAGDIGRFHRFIYLNAFSFGKDMRSTVRNPGSFESVDLQEKFKRYIERIKPRLENVEISSVDFRELLKRHDSSETFFYLDPPYPEQQCKLKTDLTNESIFEAVKALKGKFILSLPETQSVREVFARYNFKPVSVRRSMENRDGKGHMDSEVLISNFPLRAAQDAVRFAASTLRCKPEAWLYASMIECHGLMAAGHEYAAIDSYEAILRECARRDIELDLDPESELNSYFVEALDCLC